MGSAIRIALDPLAASITIAAGTLVPPSLLLARAHLADWIGELMLTKAAVYISAPLCQEAAVLAACFGVVEKVIVKMAGRVEDLDADEAVVFPVECDEALGAGRRAGLDRGAAGRELVAGEVDAGRVGGGVVGDPHASVVPGLPAASWQYTRSGRCRLRRRGAFLGVLPSVRLRWWCWRPGVPGLRIWVTAVMCRAWLTGRFPVRGRRRRTWSPEETSIGAVPL
jgi:hypothetical protein